MVQLGGEPFVQEYSEVPQGTKIVRIDDKNDGIDLNDI